MYRLLIVDDEPDVADGLYNFFRNAAGIGIDLDVCKAYSAFEALDALNSSRVDILLTDIMMPGMTGLQLVEKVRQQWPRCRIVFLTGYNEFDYIYAATKFDTVSYLLKTESFEAIAGAVQKAAGQIGDSLKLDELEEQTGRYLATMIPLMRRELVWGLVLEGGCGADERERQFVELGIGLDARKPVLLLLGHIQDNEGRATVLGKTRVYTQINEFAEKIFAPTIQFLFSTPEQRMPLWLVQPADGSGGPCHDPAWKQLPAVVKDCAEAVQEAAEQTLGVCISFAVDSEATAWEALPERYDQMKRQLHSHPGQYGDMLLISGDFTRDASWQIDRTGLMTVKRMEVMLENGQKDKYFKALGSLATLANDSWNGRPGGSIAVFHSLSALLLSYISLRNLQDKAKGSLDMVKLIHLEEHGSWQKAMEYFAWLSEALFDMAGEDNPGAHEALISGLKEYIETHLQDDLSLVRLAGRVHFNPAYLSRLFKKTAGVNLLGYINEARITRVKELLADTSLKVHEIAAKVGYESPSYFTQFFKRMTGISPQDYRDKHFIGR